MTRSLHTCAFVVSRAQSDPRTQMFLRWKLFHSWSHLRQDPGGSFFANAGYGLQKKDRSMVLFHRFNPDANLRLEFFDRGVKKFKMGKALPDEKTLDLWESMPFQRRNDFRDITFGVLLRAVCHLARCEFA